MNDMDTNSVKLGGVASYFVNEYEKYSWKILLNNKNITKIVWKYNKL